MSLDPTLLVRRWPERRPVVLAAAAAGSVGAFVAMYAAENPALGALFVLPVMLAALELGLAGGLAAGAVGGALLIAAGAVAPAVAAVAAAAVAGRFSDRMRGAHAREHRLLDSGLALGAITGYDELPRAIAAAALRTPRVGGAEVRLDGAPTAAAGRMDGGRAEFDIVVRGSRFGAIVVSHRMPLELEDREALELLALQAGLAADNQRLLEQRSGLGRLLDAHEDDRRRLAETLHEQLAQALAAVLLGLRMERRHEAGGSLDELHAQIVSVLNDVRDMAGELRPASLGQLGLVPALQALAQDGFTLEAQDVPEQLPEPLRTSTYRLIETALSTARPGAPARVHLAATDRQLELDLDLDLADASEPLAAVWARTALLSGSLDAEPLPDGRTRVLVRLPLQGLAPTGSVARTTVLPGAD
jgi:signal transduction histidine kinase